MYVERLLQINLAALAAIGALLLGMGQQSVILPLLVIVAAAVSMCVTDIMGWFRLGRRAANVAMIIALLACLLQLYPLVSETQAMAIGRFLVCLQIVLFFQPKDARTYWFLVMLSLMQVVVATLFSQGVWFGAILMVFVPLCCSAMTLLLLHRQWSARSVAPEPQQRHGQRRWPLMGERIALVSSPGGNVRAAVGWRLVRRLLRMAAQTMAIAVVVFVTVPRYGRLGWQGALAAPRALTGFSDEVVLGKSGILSESREEVMRVRFYNGLTDDQYLARSEISLRGAVLMDYQDGQWQIGEPAKGLGAIGLGIPSWLPRQGLVRQEITIESLDRGELFYVAPYVPLPASMDIQVDMSTTKLFRPDESYLQRYRYEFGTTAFVDGQQRPLMPAGQGDRIEAALQMPKVGGRSAAPGLVALADRWIRESGLPPEDRAGRAQYLTRQLSGVNDFVYSLGDQPRDADLDPVEDFVTKHRVGHCEYFATALVLMLRSQGIPARLVMGFKTNEWHDLGSYFQVRQLHAHAWAEAFLEPSQLPAELLHGRDYWSWRKFGGWLQLDPAPAGAIQQASSQQTSFWKRSSEWLEFTWTNYVMEMNYRRQYEDVYAPLVRASREAVQSIFDAAERQNLLERFGAALSASGSAGLAAWALLAIATLAGITLLALAVRGIWRLQRRLRIRWTGANTVDSRRRATRIEFYRRLELLLARHGLVRLAGQTPREFAVVVGARLAEWDGQGQLAAGVAMVVDTFYRVRFGHQPLDTFEVRAVQKVLTELATLEKEKR